jgi:hypothetical protein
VKDKISKRSKQVVQEGRDIFENMEELVLSVALLVCAFYNYYDLSIRGVGNVEYYVRLTASVVIAVWGANLLVQHFKRKKA